MQALQCDFCGGSLVIDDSREFAVCEFCGTKYMASTLRAKIQEIRGTVKVEGAVETVTGSAEKERLIKNAGIYKGLNEFYKAIDTYIDITHQFPDDYRGWWGMYTCFFDLYFVTGEFYNGSKDITNPKILNNAYTLCKDKSVINSYFETIPERYGNKIHLLENINCRYYSFSNFHPTPKPIDKMTEWLIYSFDFSQSILPDKLKKFLSKLTVSYIQGIESGSIFPTKIPCKPPFYNYVWNPITPSQKNEQIAEYILNKSMIRYTPIYDWSKNNSPLIGFEIKDNGLVVKFDKIDCIIGKWVFISGDTNNISLILLPEKFTQKDIYKSMHCCQHCGGKFKGILNPVCQQCGKKRDY